MTAIISFFFFCGYTNLGYWNDFWRYGRSNISMFRNTVYSYVNTGGFLIQYYQYFTLGNNPGVYIGTRHCCGSTRLVIYGNSWYRQNLHVIWAFPIRAWNYYDYLISWLQEHPIFKGFFYFDYTIFVLEYTGTRLFYIDKLHFMLTSYKGVLTMANKPLNISLMNIPAFIQRNNCGQVTSTFIYESSSKEFAKNGLFSEDIFGQIGSPDRLIKFGYIDLHTTIFHPIVYANLISLKALYGDIMARKVYAKFDTSINDFVRCEEDDDGANTGFKFFIDNFKKINFIKNDSISQNDKVSQITGAGPLALVKQCLVMPAQIRDVDPNSTRLDPDSINKLYISLINYANALPASGVVSAIYDGIRFSIQKKVSEIYQYIFNMIEGKFGYFQGKYGSRNLALGTRNVISPAPLNASASSAGNQLKCDELGVPLFEAAKASMPLVIYHAKSSFFNSIFSASNDQVALIDPKTYDLVYKPISEDEKNKFISSDGIEKLVNLFRDREFRFKPMTCKTEDNKYYYLFLIYDEGHRVQITRSISSLRNYLDEKHRVFKPECLRPITYAEFFYIVTYLATIGKYCTITRYPCQEIGSTVPCKVHLLTTHPSREVDLYLGDSDISEKLSEYPILGKGFQDSIAIHESVVNGLNCDYDGDTVSVSILLSDEANQECQSHIDSVGRWLTNSGSSHAGRTYLVSMPLYNLTRDPQ